MHRVAQHAVFDRGAGFAAGVAQDGGDGAGLGVVDAPVGERLVECGQPHQFAHGGHHLVRGGAGDAEHDGDVGDRGAVGVAVTVGVGEGGADAGFPQVPGLEHQSGLGEVGRQAQSVEYAQRVGEGLGGRHPRRCLEHACDSTGRGSEVQASPR